MFQMTCFIVRYSLLGSIKAWLFGDERLEDIKELKRDFWLLLIAAPVVAILSNSGYFFQTLLPVNYMHGTIIVLPIYRALKCFNNFVPSLHRDVFIGRTNVVPHEISGNISMYTNLL